VNFQRITGRKTPVEASFPQSGTRALAENLMLSAYFTL